MLILLAIAMQTTVLPWQTVNLPDGGHLRFQPVTAGNDDYPRSAKRADIEGVTLMELTITVRGAVERCTILSSAGSADLDRKACELIRERGHFNVVNRTKPVVVRQPIQWTLQ